MVKSAKHVGLAPHNTVTKKDRDDNRKSSPKYKFMLLKLTYKDH